MRAPERRWLEVLAPCLLTGWFLVTAILGVAARYRAVDLLALTAVYFLLSCGLHQGTALLRALFRAPGAWAGAYLLGLTLIWQLREQTFLPTTIPGALLWAVPLAPALYWTALRPLPRRGWPRHLARTLVSLAALGLLIVSLTGSSELFRWHLLRHNTLLGTPTYYLLEPPVTEVREELVARLDHRPPPVDRPAGTETATETAPTGPHLVFVLLDTLRADALAAWRGEPGPMPRLDAYLEQSWRFTDVWANSSWTRPSMASFFTGLLPEEHGARGVDDALAPGFDTLAERLDRRGYRTVAFVANLAAVGKGAGFAQGFHEFHELQRDPYARAARVHRAVDAWLEENNPSGPVFLYLHYLDPHEPYLAGDPPRRKRPEPYRRAYAAELGYLDRELARTLRRIEEGLPGPEAVVVASDHGEELFEHGLFGHGQNLYEEVLQIPVALRLPDEGSGDLSARLEARDFFSLLGRIGAGDPVDPASWAEDRDRRWRYASLDYSTTGRLVLRPYLRRVVTRALQVGDEKLVWSAYGKTRELYDLAVDPRETVNRIAERTERTEILTRRLDEVVGSWVESTPVEVSDAERDQLKALGYVD